MKTAKCKKYVLISEKLKVTLTNVGAAITGVELADAHGKMRDVVLGYDILDQYLCNDVYFGAVIGRYAGEIVPPSLIWGNRRYELSTDKNGRHLHGGEKGISFKIWDVQNTNKGISFFCTSDDKEGGYPESIRFYAKYSLENESTLVLEYGAQSENETPVNMTAHPYFNLDGHASNRISEHSLYIDADQYTLTSGPGLLSGKKFLCKGSGYDFGQLTRLNKKQYDCNYILRKQNEWDAMLVSHYSGIYMRICCTQPCMQLYTSCETNEIGKKNTRYKPCGAVCLEPQHLPNAVNIDKRMVPVAGKHSQYHHSIRYTFGVQNFSNSFGQKISR